MYIDSNEILDEIRVVIAAIRARMPDEPCTERAVLKSRIDGLQLGIAAVRRAVAAERAECSGGVIVGTAPLGGGR